MRNVVSNLDIFNSHPAWPEVQKIWANLNANGFEALLAGGCVRDLIMHRVPKDFDIATNATPDEVAKLYPKALSVGREFGVIILAYENFQIEIASFRRDGPYLDGRRPSHIVLATPEEDARRRDFTVNALFFNIGSLEVIDYVDGVKDIQAKLIKAVGDPALRFTEDKLRMLRALRFSSQLDFEIEASTLRAISEKRNELGQVSSERITDEICKWLNCSNLLPCLNGLWTTGLLKRLHSNFEKYFDQSAYDDLTSYFSTSLINISISVKLCLLFSCFVKKNQDIEFDDLKHSLKSMKFSKDQISEVLWILKYYFKFFNFKDLALYEQIEICAHSSVSSLRDFSRIVNPSLSKSLEPQFLLINKEYLVNAKLPKAFLDGESLKALGFKPGREMGEALKEIYRLQIEKKITTPQEALNFAKRKL